MEIDHVVAIEGELKVVVFKRDGGGEGVAQIFLMDDPAFVAGPEELPGLRAGMLESRPRPGSCMAVA